MSFPLDIAVLTAECKAYYLRQKGFASVGLRLVTISLAGWEAVAADHSSWRRTIKAGMQWGVRKRKEQRMGDGGGEEESAESERADLEPAEPGTDFVSREMQ